MSQTQPPNDVANSAVSLKTSAGPIAAGSYAYVQNQPSDEIDLVELLGFFWKIKIEIILGTVLGIVAGGIVAFKVLPVTYRTQIPLVLDKNEIGVTEPKKLVESFNNALNVSDNARLVWRSVFNQSPELARTLKGKPERFHLGRSASRARTHPTFGRTLRFSDSNGIQHHGWRG